MNIPTPVARGYAIVPPLMMKYSFGCKHHSQYLRVIDQIDLLPLEIPSSLGFVVCFSMLRFALSKQIRHILGT